MAGEGRVWRRTRAFDIVHTWIFVYRVPCGRLRSHRWCWSHTNFNVKVTFMGMCSNQHIEHFVCVLNVEVWMNLSAHRIHPPSSATPSPFCVYTSAGIFGIQVVAGNSVAYVCVCLSDCLSAMHCERTTLRSTTQLWIHLSLRMPRREGWKSHSTNTHTPCTFSVNGWMDGVWNFIHRHNSV